MAKTVHVIGGDPATVKMFAHADWNCWDDKPDLVCFTGGADISPELYCQLNTNSCGVSPHRDIHEIGQYMKYLRQGIPMVGICRGAQFLNVMNGGSLVQHIDNHGMRKSYVDLFEDDGRLSKRNKTAARVRLYEDHHQGIVPAEHATVLGLDANDKNVEIVLYLSKHQSGTYEYHDRHLCFQAHPEWGHDPTRELFFELIERYLV